MKSKRGNISFTGDKLLQWKRLIRQKDFKLLIGVEIPSKHLRFLSSKYTKKYMMESSARFS